ncbi:MAG: methyltransferase family protein [Candidatus Hodarchaeota archaeon]
MSDAHTYKMTWKFWIGASILGALFIAQILLSVLFYNSAGLNIILYCGWILLIGTMVLFLFSNVLQKKGGVPEGKSYEGTTFLVDSGIYSVIRHPIYCSFILLFIALVCLSQHWFSVLASIPLIISMYWIMIIEEKVTLERFGDAYKRYMQNVPRINILLGVYRRLRHQKREKNR